MLSQQQFSAEQRPEMRNSSSQLTDRDHADVRSRRLLFRCGHRGTQESDLILGPFAERSLANLDSAQLDRFEALLDCADPDLFEWIFGGSVPPPEHDHDLMRLLRDFCAARSQTTARQTASI